MTNADVKLAQSGQWHCDIFCRVIDNFGDVGVALRLARQLAHEYNFTVRLVVDDTKTSAAMTTVQTANLQVCTWLEAQSLPEIVPEDALNTGISRASPANLLLIEAFGCALPESYIEALAVRYGSDRPNAARLRWLNLEYLSAETWVESHHLLPSPHPRLPLTKTFFFPGFTARTGGLLRERDLALRRDKFLSTSPDFADGDPAPSLTSKQQFLIKLGVPSNLIDHALFVFLFCYENAALPALLQAWQQSTQPIVVLLPADRTHAAVCAALA